MTSAILPAVAQLLAYEAVSFVSTWLGMTLGHGQASGRVKRILAAWEDEIKKNKETNENVREQTHAIIRQRMELTISGIQQLANDDVTFESAFSILSKKITSPKDPEERQAAELISILLVAAFTDHKKIVNEGIRGAVTPPRAN